MSKALRNFLIVAGILVIVGALIAGIGFFLGGMKPIGVTSNGLVIDGSSTKNMVQVNEKYSDVTSVKVNIDAAELTLQEGDSFSLQGSYNSSYQDYSFTQQDGVLNITGSSTKKGIWLLGGWNSANDNLTLTYPKGTKFDDMDITVSLGSLNINTLDTSSLEVSLDAGSLKGNNISTDTYTASFHLGSCTLDQFSLKDSGNLSLDAGSLSLSGSTANNLSVDSHLGSVDIAGTLTGKTSLGLDLGSLTLSLDNAESESSYSVSSDLGSVKINGTDMGNSVSKTTTSPVCTLDATLSAGSANLSFK